MDFVIYDGKKYEIKEGTLYLNRNGIEDILDIENFDKIPQLRELYLSDNKITEIKGLDKLIDLEILKLDGNEITEIKGLENLKNLKELSLSHNNISEIRGINELVNLKRLDLFNNEIRKMRGLESLIKLKELNLNFNKVNEISSIASLKKLAALFLKGNDISLIEGLENLNNLRFLNLWGNKITEIKGLDTLTNLVFLNLERNPITKLKGLGKLINLDEFRIGASKIKEIAGLGALKNLRKLKFDLSLGSGQFPMRFINLLGGLYYNTKEAKDPQKIVNYCRKLESGSVEFVIYKEKKYNVAENSLDLHDQRIKNIHDIEGLEKLTHLKSLDLSRNVISRIEGLENLQNLEFLNLSENRISKIENLDKLTKLRQLRIRENNITKIEGLENLTNLYRLSMSKNKISVIGELESLQNLKILSLRENQIIDISNLRTLKSLQDLYLRENKIIDISNLRTLKSLQDLDLSYNKIKDISDLENLKDLRDLYLRDNEISEVLSLSRLPKLKNLSLHDNKIGMPRRLKGGFVSEQQIEYVRLIGKIYDNNYEDLSKEQINILKELLEMGHVDAKRVYTSIIIDKSKEGDLEAFKNLFEGGDYLKSFEIEKIKSLFQDPNIKFIKSILSNLENVDYYWGEDKRIIKFLIDNSQFIDKQGKNAIVKWVISLDYEILKTLIMDGFLKCLDKDSAEIIMNEVSIKKKLVGDIEEGGFRSLDSLKILSEFTSLGYQTAKNILKEKILISIKKSSNFRFSEILEYNSLDYYDEKEFNTFLKESSPYFLTEFLNQLNRDYGVYVDDFSHTETDNPEEIKKILGETIIKLISLKEPEKVYKSKKYINFLSVLNDISIIFRLLDILRESTGINLFAQVKELLSKSSILDIKFLTKLLGELVIHSVEIKTFKISAHITSEKYYYISEIFRELHDLFRCILLGYFSEDETTLLEQINIILELGLNLNQAISYEIVDYFDINVDLNDIETEYERFKVKRDHFKQVFGINNRYAFPSITLKIENQKLKISYPSYLYEKDRLEEINQRDLKFVLNQKKILTDNVIEQEWFKNFLQDYYETDYSVLIGDLTEDQLN